MTKEHSGKEVVVPDAVYPFTVHANGLFEGKPGYGKTKILSDVIDVEPLKVTPDSDAPRSLSSGTDVQHQHHDQAVEAVITLDDLRQLRGDPTVQAWMARTLATSSVVDPAEYIRRDK